MESEITRNVIDFTVSREIKSLYKTCLEIVEEVVNNPPDDPYNYDKDAVYQKYRKKILDKGNDCQKSIFKTIDLFEIDFRKKE